MRETVKRKMELLREQLMQKIDENSIDEVQIKKIKRLGQKSEEKENSTIVQTLIETDINFSSADIVEECHKIQNLSKALKTIVDDLHNELSLEHAKNEKHSQHLNNFHQIIICREVVYISINKAIEKHYKKENNRILIQLRSTAEKIKKDFRRQKGVLLEKLRCTEFTCANLNSNLAKSKDTISSLRSNLQKTTAALKTKETDLIKEQTLDLHKQLENQTRHLQRLEEEKKELKRKQRILQDEFDAKGKQLKSLSDSLEQSKTMTARKIEERVRTERNRIDQIIRLHQDETSEYENVIKKRDADIKELYAKLAEQDNTISKMGENLIRLSRNEEDAELKKSLDMAEIEILKLKSKIANLTEIKESQPASISSALQKAFKQQKEINILKKKNLLLKKEIEKNKEETKDQKEDLEKIQHNLELFKEESERRTSFYRSVTESVLDRFKTTFGSMGEEAKISGLEEMYRIVTQCEKSNLATPRLKRIIGRFGSQRSKSQPKD